MPSKTEKFDALVESALEDGETVESYGDYDEDSEEGRDVELIQDGGLWLVAERTDDEDDIKSYADEEEARKAFKEIKKAIEEEDDDE